MIFSQLPVTCGTNVGCHRCRNGSYHICANASHGIARPFWGNGIAWNRSKLHEASLPTSKSREFWNGDPRGTMYLSLHFPSPESICRRNRWYIWQHGLSWQNPEGTHRALPSAASRLKFYFMGKKTSKICVTTWQYLDLKFWLLYTIVSWT